MEYAFKLLSTSSSLGRYAERRYTDGTFLVVVTRSGMTPWRIGWWALGNDTHADSRTYQKTDLCDRRDEAFAPFRGKRARMARIAACFTALGLVQ